MTRFANLMDLRREPGAGGRFLDLIAVDAAESVGAEPGRCRFDVLSQRRVDPDTVSLSRIYEDRAAFEAHLKAAHFAAFKEATAEMVEGTVLRKCDVRENAV